MGVVNCAAARRICSSLDLIYAMSFVIWIGWDMYGHVSVVSVRRKSGDSNAIRLAWRGRWRSRIQCGLERGNRLRFLFFDPVRPPIRVPIAYAPLFCPFPDYKINPAFIRSFQMVRPQESQTDPLDAAQQLTRSSGLSDIPFDERLDRFIYGRSRNKLFDLPEGFTRIV